MPASKVSKKHLTSVPADVMRRLGIEEGDILLWEVNEEGKYAIVRVLKNPLRRLKGKYNRKDITYDKVEEESDKIIMGEAYASDRA